MVTCCLCSRVTDLPTNDLEKDLEYDGDLELMIREWMEKEMHLQDGKYSCADVCKNHLKLLETFCIDDKTFTCWMCHNFNYSDDHRGHKVVGLEEAYQLLKEESQDNLTLIA